MEKGYKYTGYIMLLLLVMAIVAFYKTYFGQFPNFEVNTTALSHSAVSMIDHIHVVFALLWIGLLIGQPLLIRFGRYKTHRRLGRISYLIFPMLILTCIQPIIRILKADHAMLAYLPISDSVLLILFYVLAIFYRKDTAKHMRYMIGTSLVFLGPIFGRIGPTIFNIHPKIANHINFAVLYVLLSTLIYLDKKTGRNYRPYVIILACFMVKQFLFTLLL